MPTEPEGLPADHDPDDEGGPVKSFLEHLEDLRWVLIKTLVSLGVAFVVCLIAGDRVVSVLTFPLKRAKIHYSPKEQVVTFMFATNRLGVFQVAPDQQTNLDL